MRIYILGSCSGTEPEAGRHHTSWVLEHDGSLFWFDAGETCSRTAHLLGLDLLKTRGIFLSHPHMDHVGGLPNLLWTIRKLGIVRKDGTPFDLPVFTPSVPQAEAMLAVLRETEGGFAYSFRLALRPVADGALAQFGGMRVDALHNLHLGEAADGKWRSFSFRISLEGKTIVYSGDVGSIRDLDPWSADCDLLMMESGHHFPPDVCSYLEERNAQIGKILFVHHGCAMLRDPEGMIAECRTKTAIPVEAAFDGMKLEL